LERSIPEGRRQLVVDVSSGTRGDLRLTRITKSYGDFTAVNDLSLTIPEGSFFALLGPSGCGKTTTLRMIAGLEEPTVGSIHLGSTDITTKRPYQRPINTVFQNYALFPHLTIFENIAFGLRRRGIKNVDADVNKVLELVELPHLAQRKPTQLSGGQQQRIALARAILTVLRFFCWMSHWVHLISNFVVRCRLSSSGSSARLDLLSFTSLTIRKKP
jgi:spermidine/putrescine transport system ATP-binding protein